MSTKKALYPLKFHPIFHEKIWGGAKVKTILNKNFGLIQNCGETWEVSTVNGNVFSSSGIWASDTPIPATGIPYYFLIDIEGLNKTDECSLGADRSGFPDSYFAKSPLGADTTLKVFYNDHSAQENIAHYAPAIGKLDRMHIRTRFHNQKSTSGYIYWSSQYSLTFEIEMLDNVFDDFSQFETRVMDRS
jgi:hypothetical protein